MSFSVSPWNIIRSMKAVDEWQAVLNSNIVGSARVGYKSSESYFGGGISYILQPPGLNAAAKQIAEQVLSTNHTWINFKQGELNQSSEWMHTAVQGEGFFMTSAVLGNPDPETDIQYTRNGEWHLDNEGFLRTNEGLYVMDGTYIPGSGTNPSTAIPPWVGSIFDSWFAREEVVVVNNSSRTITQDTVVEVEFDAQKLINTGQINDPTDLNDVRIGYYQDPPGNPAGWTELPREIVTGTGGTANTVLRFRLQDDVAPGQTLTDKYFVYYQGPTGAPVAATGNQAIGLVDPTGGEDDFGGFFNPQDDFLQAPGDPRSVEDWVNEFGGERWRAGLPDSPSDTWAGAKAGHITYDNNNNGIDGYFIETTTSGAVSVNSHSSIVAEEVFRKSDGFGGWTLVDALGNEIMMDVINGTNLLLDGSTHFNPNYDFRLSTANIGSHGYQFFTPGDIIAAGWDLPDLTSGGGTNIPHSTSPGPNGSWNGVNFVPGTSLVPGDSNFDADDSVWSDNNKQYTLLRQPIHVSAEGIARDSVGGLSELVDINGFVDHDVSVFLRTASGALIPIYEDNVFNNNLWNGSAFEPYDALEVGENWIEIYASHEVVSPPNVPPFQDNGSGYTIGPAQAQMEANGWDIGGSDPGAWRITDHLGTGYTAAGAPAAYGNIIYSTTNSDNYIFRGSNTWDDYSITSTVGVAATDDDMVMLWARVQNDTTVAAGPRSGYAFVIQRPGDSGGVGVGSGHQIGLARFDAGVPTYLATEHTHPDLMTWFNNNVIDSNGASPGGSWTRQHWNFKLQVEGNQISIYAGTAGNSTTLAGAVPATPLATVTDNTYSSGKFAMKTISQVAWFDNIVFEPTVDRKTGLRVDDGQASQRGIQSIHAFETQARYSTDGVNVYDHFGNPNQALTDASSTTLETTAVAGDNRYRTSNADGNLNTNGDNDGLRDYDPGTPFIVDSLANVPIYETRLVQYDPNPGSETRISTDGDNINQGTPDLLEYPGSNTWNEYAAELNWGVSVPGAGGDNYIYMRHLDDNNWVRLRYSEPGYFIEKSAGGVVTTLASDAGYTMGDPVVDGDRIRFEVEGRNYRVTRNGVQLFDVTDNTNPILTGRFALGNTRSAWYDDLEVMALPLSRYETWLEGFMQPTGPEDILNHMKLVMFPDNQGLHYDPIWGGVYFKETEPSGAAQVKTPGQDGAGDLHVYKLEASNVDTGAQIAKLASAKDVFDVLTKQFMVYTDTIDSTLRLFK